jgi:hypothetical protein
MNQPMIEVKVNYTTNKEEFEKEVQEIIYLADKLKKKLNELNIHLKVSEEQTKSKAEVQLEGTIL